jgi:hypothetical protein
VYLTPDQTVADPSLLARLADAGIDHVVLRTGFDASRVDPLTESGAACIRQAGMGLVLLIGGWWGEGVAPGSVAMTPFVDDLPPASPRTAHESQWPMHCPLGPWTRIIAQTASELTRRLTPDAICLTHARFHHAADLPGLFTQGSSHYTAAMESHGLWPGSISGALRRVADRLSREQTDAIVSMRAGEGLAGWLDAWLEGDMFSRWFSFRQWVIGHAVDQVQKAVRSVSRSPSAFGVNMLNPLWCDLSGQGVASTMRGVDFVQPLLGYIHWHVAQPLEAWAALLVRMQPALRVEDARRVLARVIGADSLADACEDLLQAADRPCTDLLNALMDAYRSRLIAAGGSGHNMQIVLRGSDWPGNWLREEERRWRGCGFAHIVYQGIDRIQQPFFS